MTHDGVPIEHQKNPQFLQQLPSLAKLNLDGQYLGHIEDLYKGLRNLDGKTRAQLLKNNDHMEEDDYRGHVENLKGIQEKFRSMALGDEPDQSETDSGEDS